MKVLKTFERFNSDEITVKDFNTVLRDGEVIGYTHNPTESIPDGMTYTTFFLIFREGTDEENTEEIDVVAKKGSEYIVAEALAKAGYNPGYRLVSHDDYTN